MKDLIQRCEMEEKKYQFDSFSQNDAKKLGELMYECSLKYEKPVAIEIRMNHLTVYRCFPNGTNQNNELWLAAKANTVDMLGISTLHLFAEIANGADGLLERRMDEKKYAQVGGGFPLILKNSGVVGTICASGLPHTEDHQVIIDALEKYFQ